jgi:hypothetical protein
MAAAQKVKDCFLLDKRTSLPLGAQLCIRRYAQGETLPIVGSVREALPMRAPPWLPSFSPAQDPALSMREHGFKSRPEHRAGRCCARAMAQWAEHMDVRSNSSFSANSFPWWR